MGAEADLEAGHVEAGHLAGHRNQGGGIVERSAAQGDGLAGAAQVGGGQALLAGGDDGDAGGERAPRRGVEPQSRVDRHARGRGGGEPRAQRGQRRSELAGQTAHHVGQLEVGECSLGPPAGRLGGPGPGAHRVGVVEGLQCAHESAQLQTDGRHPGSSVAPPARPWRWARDRAPGRRGPRPDGGVAMSTPVGMRVSGRYRLEARIGHGGMSTVYRALRRDARAAGGDQGDEPRDRERLRPARALPARGARGGAALHPHIVGVIDAGEDEGRALHRVRVRRGRDAQGADPPRWAAADRRGGRVRDRDRPRARRRPRAPHRPPRRQAAERPDRRGGVAPRSPTSGSPARSTRRG